MAYRRNDVFMVAVDDQFVLVDRRQGVMHILNASGAYAWSMLGRAEVDPAFCERLASLGLTSDHDEGNTLL
jgi:hypothetical protein